MSSQTFTGYWFQSDVPDCRQAGTLSITPDGIVSLTLIEGFDLRRSTDLPDGSLSIDGRRRRVPLIHGQTTAGKDITLIDSLIARENMGFGKPTEQILSARFALVGTHVPAIDSEIFDSCSLRIENLRTWMGIGDYYVRQSDDDSEASLTLKSQITQPVNYEEFEITARVSTPFFTSTSTRDGQNFNSQATVTLTIKSTVPQSHSGFHAISMGIVDLVTIASDRACGVISQTLAQRPEPVQYPDIKPDGTITTTTVLETPTVQVFAKRVVTAQPSDRSPHSHDLLFTCRDMPFETILPRWLELRSRIKRSTNMLLSLKYSKPGFMQNQVLAAAVASETLSRCLRPDSVAMLPQDFNRLVEKVRYAVESMDLADRARFQGLLRNEPTYSDRLDDIASLPPKSVVDKIIPDREGWKKELKGVRNGLAHGLEQNSRTDINLFLLLQRTQYLLYIVIMNELGFSESVQNRAVETNQYISYLHAEQD